MIALLSTILGFAAPFLGDLMALLKGRQDHKNKLDVMRLEMQMRQLGHSFTVDELLIQKEIEQMKGVYASEAALPPTYKWVDALRASVRPVITYCFFGLFAFIKILTVISILKNGGDLLGALTIIWDDEAVAIFGSIMGFWFGASARSRILGRNQDLSKNIIQSTIPVPIVVAPTPAPAGVKQPASKSRTSKLRG